MTTTEGDDAEVVELARALIRVDTSRGRETEAAEILIDYLTSAGVPCELVARAPDRANLVARLAGAGGGESLAFVGHTDVVPADETGWRHPPFAAVVDDDGYLYGRGAVDMKAELAARAVAMARIGRAGLELTGDLWLLGVADEEDGSADVGMRWLLEQRTDIRPTYAVNEGGGERYLDTHRREHVLLDVGEKGCMPVRVTALGEAGHAAMPTLGNNAVRMVAELVARLGYGVAEAPREEPWAGLVAANPVLVHRLRALGGTTFAPTRLTGSRAVNVMPARASVDVDCRVLPGTTGETLRAELADLLGSDLPHEVTPLLPWVPGSESPPDSRFVQALRAILARSGDRAAVVPTVVAGFTDSVHLRACGTHAYGYTSLRHTPAEHVLAGFHNVDESVHVADLADTARLHEDLARQLLADDPAARSPHVGP